jgi:hypothetical protein
MSATTLIDKRLDKEDTDEEYDCESEEATDQFSVRWYHRGGRRYQTASKIYQD